MTQTDRNSVRLPLVIAVTPEALFDLGVDSGSRLLGAGTEAVKTIDGDKPFGLRPGTVFEPIRRLLSLNVNEGERLVDVVAISERSPEDALTLFHTIEDSGLPIVAASFTNGRPLAEYLEAWNVDLLLSTNEAEVRAAAGCGVAAAKFEPGRARVPAEEGETVHLAFDADGVILNSDSDNVFRNEGLRAFAEREARYAQVPIARGAFGGRLLGKLAEIRRATRRNGKASPLRFSVVTAREAPAHERLLRTLELWDIFPDEIHFVGHRQKAPFLKASGAHLFFDDREAHVVLAQAVTAAGLALSR